MIYALIGTDIAKRKKALLAFLNGKTPTYSLYKETLFQLDALIDAQDLFGGEVVVVLDQIASDKEGRDVLKGSLSRMQESKNIFIIDEPFVETSFVKTLEKYAQGFVDAREEKEARSFPAAFLSAVEKRDKKNAWIELMKLRSQDADALHGALWWKIKLVWLGIKNGKRSAFSEDEIAVFGFRLVKASHLAHFGEANLFEEMEKMVLGL